MMHGALLLDLTRLTTCVKADFKFMGVRLLYILNSKILPGRDSMDIFFAFSDSYVRLKLPAS
jgi:hypothetical protein